jgi:regulatory protein
MTDDPEPHPDRPPPARSVRVASFDALGVAGNTSARVAGFDEIHDASRPPSRVAGLQAVEGTATAARAAPGSGAAATTAGRAARGSGAAARAADADAANAARAADAAVADAAVAHAAVADAAVDDGIPPDRPLPRGRRRGGRVGRRGPDAPDPAAAELLGPGSSGPEPAADPVAAAREICLRLLTDRARTRQELAGVLARKGVPAEAAAAVLDRFDEVGLIDDAAFAGQWVRSRHEHRGLGRRAIAVELRRKGVADDVAGEALAGVDAAAEARRARELVDRKLRSLAVDTPEKRATAGRKLVGMLARKGYGAGTAYQVVREALAEHGADVDEIDPDLS